MAVPRLKRCASLGIMNILETGKHVLRQASTQSFPHVHDTRTMEICYLSSGQMETQVAGQRYTLSGGDVLVVKPLESHGERGYPDQRGVLYWIKLDIPKPGEHSFLNLSGAPAMGFVFLLHNMKPRYFRGTPQLKFHLESVLKYLDTMVAEATTPALIYAHIISFILEVLRCAEAQRKKPQPAWKDAVISHIDTNIAESLTIRDLARLAGLTPSWFKASFKEEFGIPPMEYVMRRKIALARKMIIHNTNKNLTDIAMDLGFASSQSFSTSFKRYCGLSPTDFRKMNWGE